MSKFFFSDEGFEDYVYWQTQDPKTLKKINNLLKSIDRDGTREGIGKPEPLRYKEGVYSRRIDGKNRLIYRVLEGGVIYIASCRGHYDD